MRMEYTFVIPKPVHQWLIKTYPQYAFWPNQAYVPEPWLHLVIMECDSEYSTDISDILLKAQVPFNRYAVLRDLTTVREAEHFEHYMDYFRYPDGQPKPTLNQTREDNRVPFTQEDWKQSEVFAFKEMLRPCAVKTFQN